jgi:hypothetical protein
MRGVLFAMASFIVWGAAACGGTKPPTGAGSGSGSVAANDACAAAKPNVTALYEAEAKATDQTTHDPTYVDDNVAMVMKDCTKDPAKLGACAQAAKTVPALEHDCLVPLDEEGTEGKDLK